MAGGGKGARGPTLEVCGVQDWFAAVLEWEALKMEIGEVLNLSEPVLHVLVGLGIYLAATPILRARIGDWRPLIPVVLAEAANETSDVLRYLHSGWRWTANGTVTDILFTLVPPLAIIVFVRAAREHRAARA